MHFICKYLRTYHIASAAYPWTLDQTIYLRMRCAAWIRNKKTMTKEEALQVKEDKPLLFAQRDWRAIKNKVGLTLKKTLDFLNFLLSNVYMYTYES